MRPSSPPDEPTAASKRQSSYLELSFLAAVVVFAFIYYRDAYRLGFDWGDMGSYAQYVRELTLGAKFGDVLGYGPLWYFLGVGVFHLWGADFGAVLIVFQGVIFVSACMIWLAAREASGSAVAAGVALLCVICVPPFYASSIRMLNLALFAYPLICFAKAERGRDFWPLAATAAAIGVNFALRPDFGYLYTAALGIMLLLRTWQTQGRLGPRFGYLLQMAGLSAAFILVALAPMILHAALEGYLQPFLADLFSYPARLLFFLHHAGGLDDVFRDSGQRSASFLRILPFSALLHGTVAERIFAFLIYSTLTLLIVFGLNLAYRLIATPERAGDNRLWLAILMISATQWPGFALFRPDWVHFISFMHAYLILAACVAVWMIPALASASSAKWLVRTAVFALVAAQIGLFVFYGVFRDASGWGVKQAHRGAVFTAQNGVRQLVSADERRLYTDISELIEQNSKPGDRIVCVPYCAGFAFMTNRRILFREHYVDDGTLLYFPDWIDRAIALTKESQPPVVIVLDWAPNGTPESRFDVWAAPYMNYVKQTYARSIPFGMGTAWIRDPLPAHQERLESVVGYGPEGTVSSAPFNVQPNGESALWMKLSGSAGLGSAILFDDRPLKTFVDGVVVTALVPKEMLAVPGRHWLRVVNTATGMRTNSVPFDIGAPP